MSRLLNLLRGPGWGVSARGVLAGAVAGLVAILVGLALRFILGAPLPVELVNDRILPFIDVTRFLDITNRLGGFVKAKQIAYASSLASPVVIGALLGIVYARARRPVRTVGAILAVVLAALTALLWPELDANFRGASESLARALSVLGIALAFGALLATLAAAFGFLTRPAPAPVPATAQAPDRGEGPSTTRRAALVGGAGIVLAAASAGAAGALYRRGAFGYDGLSYVPRDVIPPLTPNDQFYVVTKNLIDPRVSAGAWRLRVDGAVERPFTLDIAGLEAMESVEQVATLECISNSVGGGLISNARWTGVPLPRLLERAGVRPGAVQVFAEGVDGYAHELAIDRATRDVTLVAFRMNGERLPDRHGYPARLIVPGSYGENSVKWLTRVSVQTDEEQGFYPRQGWKSERIHTGSRISAPRRGAVLAAGRPMELRGTAFAGDRGITAVEVSVDGGRTWRPAEIEYDGSPIAWTIWRYPWSRPPAGEHELVVRARDGGGELQSEPIESINPDGSSGWHRLDVTVAA